MKLFKFNYLPFFFIVLISLFKIINIDHIPIFLDEANYLSISDNVRNNPRLVLESIKGGVMPGFIVVFSIFETIFMPYANILISGRIFSITIDLINMFLVYKITRNLFNNKIALWAMIIYSIIPLNFFHSRFIMLEPFMILSFLGSLYLLTSIIKKGIFAKPTIAYKPVFLLSLTLILSYIVKPLTLVNLPAFFILPYVKLFKINFKSVFKSQILIMFAFLVFLLPLFLLISNFFAGGYAPKSPQSLLLTLKDNLFRLYLWLKIYYSFPIILFVVLGLVYGLYQKNLKAVWLLIWISSIFILVSALGGKYFYPRHLFILGIPVSILLAWFTFEFEKIQKYVPILVICAIFFTFLKFDYQTITNPLKASIPAEDRLQFFEDWPSGAGLKEAANDLKMLSEQEVNIYVGDEPFFTWVLPNVYGVDSSKLTVIKNYTGGETGLDLSFVKGGENQYVLLNREPYPPKYFQAEVVKAYPKAENRSIILYKLISNNYQAF
ncbi:MAG TPA: phospholipid carrier-dependent glycosyltransferase [Patescibacteria group bacterium]